VAFTPSGSGANASSTLSGLAAQFGVTLPSSGSTLNADYFATLVQTKPFLLPIVTRPYDVVVDGKPVTKTFAQLNDIDEDTPARTLDAALTTLINDQLTITTTSSSNLVTVAIQTKWPDLSVQMGQRLVAAVDSFSAALQRRKLEAELRFVQERIDSSQADVRVAENALQRFLLTNRAYASDPILQFEYDRLQRDVALRQSVYTSLRQSYEQTRIEVSRDTPTVTVVQAPVPPLVPDKKHLLLKVLIGLIAGGMLGVGLAIALEIIRRTPRNSRGFAEFQTLRGMVGAELRRVAVPLRNFREARARRRAS